LRVILGYAAILLLAQGPSADSVTTAQARRIAASAQLAAQEYRIGVVDGRVVLAAEVDEARLFLGEAKRAAASLPASVSTTTIAELDRALAVVAATGLPDSIDAAVSRLSAHLRDGLNIVLVEIPTRTPSLARGLAVYQRECASCHGASGAGDGPAGRGLDPAPANLADHAALMDVTPLAFYQRVTIGVAGTAMPAYETRLSPADRWAVALYASTLRQAKASGDVPDALQGFAATAEQNDAQILAALGAGASREQLAAVRAWQDEGDEVAATFATVRSRIAESLQQARDGSNEAALATAFDAYLVFEGVERTVGARDAGLAAELEGAFADLRTAVTGTASGPLADAELALLGGLERAERLVGDRVSSGNLFVQSLMIMLREGLEAILIIGALLTFLSRIGASERRRDIHLGVGAAIALSLVTAVLLETVFRFTPAEQEVLEGFTMLVAVAVLFYVSYWLLSKMEVQKWTGFVRGQVQQAVTGGSALALASAAFLAVYREGFETVLFYKALFVSGGENPMVPVLSGMAAGGVLLGGVYLAINRYGVRLPLRPFFAVTSAFLYYTAFVFAGKGIAELQAGGMVSTTVLPGWPRLPIFGIYPTVETLIAQGALVFLALVAMAVIAVRGQREARREKREATGAPVVVPHEPPPIVAEL
jgi:high-affinity iron transporter